MRAVHVYIDKLDDFAYESFELDSEKNDAEGFGSHLYVKYDDEMWSLSVLGSDVYFWDYWMGAYEDALLDGYTLKDDMVYGYTDSGDFILYKKAKDGSVFTFEFSASEAKKYSEDVIVDAVLKHCEEK